MQTFFTELPKQKTPYISAIAKHFYEKILLQINELSIQSTTRMDADIPRQKIKSFNENNLQLQKKFDVWLEQQGREAALQSYFESKANFAIKHGVGNCDDYAAITLQKLRCSPFKLDAIITVIDFVFQSHISNTRGKSTHVIVIVGSDLSSIIDSNNKNYLSKKMTEKEDIFSMDGWYKPMKKLIPIQDLEGHLIEVGKKYLKPLIEKDLNEKITLKIKYPFQVDYRIKSDAGMACTQTAVTL